MASIIDVNDLIEYAPEENIDCQNCYDKNTLIENEVIYKCNGYEYINHRDNYSSLKVDQNGLSDTPPPQIVYVCSLCFRQYGLVEDLRGHMMEYHKYVPITDDEEEENSAGVESAIKEQSHSKPAVLISSNVVKITDEKESVGSSSIEPEMRSLPFKDFRILLRAKLSIRCSESFSCAYKFESEEKVSMHANCHRANNSKLFNCNVCGLEFNSWRCCSAHLWKTHQMDVDLLHCPVCEFKSHASVLIWRHMRVHKKWRARVMRSMRVVQRRRMRQQQLEKVTAIKPPPVVNKNKYYAEKICEICNRKFVNGKTLSKHVKTVHNKIKPFICNVCGRKTARKAALIIHMRQHTGEKPLHCKSCKFSTRDPSVLNKHQLRHEKTGKFQCVHCDYNCIQTNAYKRHMRLNHPTAYAKIACDLCTYVTISEDKLKAHKQDHRKGLIINREDSMDATHASNKRKIHKIEVSADCFLPLESVDSLPHEPAVDTGGVTIPAPSEDTQFPTYLGN